MLVAIAFAVVYDHKACYSLEMNRINLKDYDAVAFDVEGTLADTIPTHHAARLEAFKAHGFGHITHEQLELGPTYGSYPADIIGGILHTALVTSSRARFVTPFLDRYDLAQYFPEELIISDDTIQAEGLEGKPAPDAYLLAMRRLETANILVFEDAVTGVMSAKKAGAAVVALGFNQQNARLFQSTELSHPPDFFVEDYGVARNSLGML